MCRLCSDCADLPITLCAYGRSLKCGRHVIICRWSRRSSADIWARGSWSDVSRSRWRCPGTYVEWRPDHVCPSQSTRPSPSQPRWWCPGRRSCVTTRNELCVLSAAIIRTHTPYTVHLQYDETYVAPWILRTYSEALESRGWAGTT